MKTPLLILTLLFAFGVTACGGDDDPDTSGLDRSATVSSLSEDEQRDLCEFSADAQGGPGTEHDCGDDTTITVQTVDECMAGAGMNSCTVGAVEDCATRSDVCDLGPCLALFECASGS